MPRLRPFDFTLSSHELDWFDYINTRNENYRTVQEPTHHVITDYHGEVFFKLDSRNLNTEH